MVLSLKPIIPLSVHGIVLDYGSAIALLGLPLIFDFKSAGLFSRLNGAAILGLSLLTKYPVAPVKVVPIQVHALGDYASTAGLLACALFLHRDIRPVFWSHLLIGVTGLIGILLTDYEEETSREDDPSTPADVTPLPH